MTMWNLGSADGTLSLSLTEIDENGSIQAPSTIWFQGVAYQVTGHWTATGPGRANASVFSLSGNNQAPAFPLYLGASGVMTGPGSSPQSIQIEATQASCADGSQQSYSGELLPNEVFSHSVGTYYVELSDGTQGALTLSMSGTFLNPAATWVHPSGGTLLNVRATWINNELSWWGATHHYGSGTWNGNQFSGTYVSNSPQRSNGTWTASQHK